MRSGTANAREGPARVLDFACQARRSFVALAFGDVTLEELV